MSRKAITAVAGLTGLALAVLGLIGLLVPMTVAAPVAGWPAVTSIDCGNGFNLRAAQVYSVGKEATDAVGAEVRKPGASIFDDVCHSAGSTWQKISWILLVGGAVGIGLAGALVATRRRAVTPQP